MTIAEELVSEIAPGLKSILIGHLILVDKIEIRGIEEDEDVVSLRLTKVTIRIEATIVLYNRKE